MPLKLLQTDVLTELVRSKLNVDRLLLRQQQGFLCVGPSGYNVFGAAVRARSARPALSPTSIPSTIPARPTPMASISGGTSSAATSSSTFDKRDDDKTNPCCLILGNSGQGKSYLLKLLLCNILESGKNVLCLDPSMNMSTCARTSAGALSTS
jgi:hypothetical protein